MDEINGYLQSLKYDTLSYIIILLVFLYLLIMRKKMTLPYSSSIYVVFLFGVTIISQNKITITLIFVVSYLLFAYFKFRNLELDYRDKVYSLKGFFNKRDRGNKPNEKSIGRIMPYNKFQLRFNNRIIKLRDEYARGITMITGSPGSGKTYGMMSLIEQDILNKKRIVMFDYKGQEEIIIKLRNLAKKYKIPIYELSEYDTNFNYDPLASLNKTGKIEALLNTRKWSMDGSDAHYRSSTQLLIQKYVNEFEEIYDETEPYTLAFYNYIKKQPYDRVSADAYFTVSKMLELILTSDMKDVWVGNNEKDFGFSIQEQYIAIFSFVSSNKEMANSISSFVFKDMLDHGTTREFNKEIGFYVDEYGTLENSLIIKDILEKGRSCGIMTTLSLQDINQIVINTNQAYLNSILGIVNTFIIYPGTTRVTAEMISGVQLYDIDSIMITLRKPDQAKRKPPTAMYISRYSTVDKEKSIDVFKIVPYIVKDKYGFIDRFKDARKEEKSKNTERSKKFETIVIDDQVKDVEVGEIVDISKIDDYL